MTLPDDIAELEKQMAPAVRALFAILRKENEELTESNKSLTLSNKELTEEVFGMGNRFAHFYHY